MGQRLVKSSAVSAAFAVLFLALLIPVNVVGNYALTAAVQVAVVVAMLSCMQVRRCILAIALIYGLSMLVLTIWALAIDADRSVTRDLLEIPKYLVIPAAFIFGSTIQSRIGFEGLYRVVSAFTLLVLAFGGLEIVNPEWFSAIKELYVRDAAVLQGKPITFYWTTYFAAAMYILLASLHIGAIFVHWQRWLSHALFWGLVVLAVFTQSRSGIFGVVVVLLVYGLIMFRQRPVLFLTVLAFAVFGTIVATIVGWTDGLVGRFAYLYQGLSRYLFDFASYYDGENSLGYRVEQILWAFTENQFVLIGAGIGKGYNEYLESWVSLFYYRYGLIGMFLYITLWFAPLMIACYAMYRKSKIQPTHLAVAVFSLSLPFLSFSSVMTDQIQVAAIYYAILGVAYTESSMKWRTAKGSQG